MSADESLGVQFMNVHTLMSPKHWDKNLGRPADFYKYDKPYIDHLAHKIRENGYDHNEPIELQPSGMIDDGHHRVYASYLANEWTVPVTHQGQFDSRLDDALKRGGWK